MVEGPDEVDLAEPDAGPGLHESEAVEVWGAVTFRAYGRYALRLTAGDGALEGSDVTIVDLRPAEPRRTLVVNTTADHDDGRCDPLPIGDCTLREAMRMSNELDGPDTIVFEIPWNDPGYDGNTDLWTIKPTRDLPAILDDWTIIDGGDITDEPTGGTLFSCGYPHKIVVNFASLGTGGGFVDNGANGVLQGLIIQGNDYGAAVLIGGSSAYNNVVRCNSIEGNPPPKSYHLWEGVKIVNGAHDNTIEGNWIGGNSAGIYMTSGVHHNTVTANWIGKVAATMSPNTTFGIGVDDGSHHNTIGHLSDPDGGNVISGNKGYGVVIAGQGSTKNVVAHNLIGVQAGTLQPLANSHDGVWLQNKASGNTIGPGNIIAYNGLDGVSFAKVVSLGITVYPGSNVVTWNSIFDNAGKGILNARPGLPVITYVALNRIEGKTSPAVAGSTVEIFESPAPAPGRSVQGKTPIGKTTTQKDGSWSWSGPVTKSTWVTATRTAAGDTSEFSSPVQAPKTLSGFVFKGKTCPEWMPTLQCLKGIYVELWTLSNQTWSKATDTISDEEGCFTLSYETAAGPHQAYRLVMADPRYRVVRAESASGGEVLDGSIQFSSVEAGVYSENLFYIEPLP